MAYVIQHHEGRVAEEIERDLKVSMGVLYKILCHMRKNSMTDEKTVQRASNVVTWVRRSVSDVRG